MKRTKFASVYAGKATEIEVTPPKTVCNQKIGSGVVSSCLSGTGDGLQGLVAAGFGRWGSRRRLLRWMASTADDR